MKTVEICPQTIHMFDCDPNLLNEVRYHVEREDYTLNGLAISQTNSTNYRSVDDLLGKKKVYEKIVNWFNNCIDEVKTLHNYECERLSITQMWSNKATYRCWHHGHTHPYSIVSGIFYVTDSNAHTWFSVKDHWKTVSDPFVPIDRLNLVESQVIAKIKTSPGKLVLFPSHLYHSVDEHMVEERSRYSISFNTFPSGKIGNFAALTGLNLEVL